MLRRSGCLRGFVECGERRGVGAFGRRPPHAASADAPAALCALRPVPHAVFRGPLNGLAAVEHEKASRTAVPNGGRAVSPPECVLPKRGRPRPDVFGAHVDCFLNLLHVHPGTLSKALPRPLVSRTAQFVCTQHEAESLAGRLPPGAQASVPGHLRPLPAAVTLAVTLCSAGKQARALRQAHEAVASAMHK